MPIIINGSGTIGGPTTFTDNLTLGTSVLATPTGAAPSYPCRAWVNFNGTGTVAIRASGNVSSITDNGTGNYTVNFTTAMPDANYSAVGGYGNDSGSTGAGWWVSRLPTYATGSCQVLCGRPDNGAYVDASTVSMSFFR